MAFIRQSPRKTAGFSLIELITVLAVMSILAAIAFPSFGWLMATTRMKASASNLHLAMLYARSEAVKRNTTVKIGAEGGDWSAGWRVWQDTNNDDSVDAGEPVFRTEIAQSRVTIEEGSDLEAIAFMRSGRLPVGDPAPEFTISDPGNHAESRCVTTGLSGMPAVREHAC
jgi:type IV fimbrial biogenesis protein FimT